MLVEMRQREVVEVGISIDAELKPGPVLGKQLKPGYVVEPSFDGHHDPADLVAFSLACGDGQDHNQGNNEQFHDAETRSGKLGAYFCSSDHQRKKITTITDQRMSPPPSFMIKPEITWSSTTDRPHKRGKES